MQFFSAIKYRGQNKRPLRSLKTEYKAHRYVTCIGAIRAVKWARQDLPKGKERETPTLCYLSADKKAMTLTGDNDTSVIRGRSIMKGRG